MSCVTLVCKLGTVVNMLRLCMMDYFPLGSLYSMQNQLSTEQTTITKTPLTWKW